MARHLLLRTGLVIGIAAIVGCSGDPRLSTGLVVRVSFDAAAKSQCARVVVTPRQGTASTSDAVARKDLIQVGVYKGKDWSDDVTVVARGYKSCTDAPDAFIESSESVATSFGASGVNSVDVKVKPGTAVVDNDNDGYAADGGDCDDSDGGTHPGAVEACSGTEDHNCSGTVGCADTACTGNCGAGATGTCSPSTRTCLEPVEVSCADGVDNDGDGQTDCGDSDCRGQSCNDAFGPCTSNDVCPLDGGSCLGTVAIVCTTPPGSCFSDAGVCQPQDGSCAYPPLPSSAPCNDSSACTQGDHCDGTGVCVGATNKVCSIPPGPCFSDAGVCVPSDGGCDYPVNLAGVCSDNNNCTVSDSCQNDGGCAGSQMPCDAGTCMFTICFNGACIPPLNNNGAVCSDGNACTQTDTCSGGNCIGGNPKSCAFIDVCTDAGVCDPSSGNCDPAAISCVPNQCETGGSCSVPTGCSFTEVSNIACDAGTGAGTCYTGACLPDFPYVPSNFDPTTLNPSENLVLSCSRTLDTSGAAPSLTLCDGGTLPLTIDGGVAILPLAGLSVPSTSALNIVGTRPLIIAVYGDANIDGTVDVGGKLAVPGAGADDSTACKTVTAGANTNNAAGAPGGGGGAHFGTGGNGGAGNGSTAAAGTGGAQSSDSSTLQPLYGGCSGSSGGSAASLAGGPAGGGGGAIQISAAGTLRITGGVNAGGGGGTQGTSDASGNASAAGGGGAGSGGSVLLEGDVLTLKSSARVAANGGSGGEGGRGQSGAFTTAVGINGGYSFAATPSGGSATNRAGDGGAGSGGTTFNASTGQAAASNLSGGGGGGGGIGRIRMNFNTMCRETNYLVSPSTAAANGGTNTAFTANKALPGTSACP